jgi:flagellin-like protein
MKYTETTQEDDAVSPVIGVILMVAITVILAAVIGTFVLGLGEQVEQNARAGVNADVDNTDDEVTISLTTLDNSDYVIVRGVGGFNASGAVSSGSISGGNTLYMSTTGASVTLGNNADSGTLTVVAVIGDDPSSFATGAAGDAAAIASADPAESATQTTVQQVDYDFT